MCREYEPRVFVLYPARLLLFSAALEEGVSQFLLLAGTSGNRDHPTLHYLH